MSAAVISLEAYRRARDTREGDTIAGRVAKMLRVRRMTLDELAAEVQATYGLPRVTPTWLRNLHRKRKLMGVETCALAHVLGVSYEWLLFGDGGIASCS